MAKELPFYKFHSNEWLTGDITFEPYDIQGVFIHVCATYWSQDCSIALARLKKRLTNVKEGQWQCLIDSGYIKVNSKGDVSISFLDEQINELGDQHKKKVEAGRKGGLAKGKQRLSSAKATLKHIDIEVDKEIEVEKETLTEFDIFWLGYNKNVGLVPCQREWAEIDEPEYAKIIRHVPKYVGATPDIKYRLNPINYLKNRVWLDVDLPTVKTKPKPFAGKVVL
jgi:hypothetical protein